MAFDYSEENIRAKIEALLKLSEGASTEEEAANAAAKAATMCLKYNIDKMSVKAKIDDEKANGNRIKFEVITIPLCDITATTPFHYNYLIDGVKQLFDVFVYFSRMKVGMGGTATQYYVMGIKENAESAVQVFSYLNTVIQNMLADRKKAKQVRGMKQADSYRKGAGYGISLKCKAHKDRLIQEMNGCRDLMVLTGQLMKNEVDSLTKRMNLKSKAAKLSIGESNAFWMGKADGEKVNLNGKVLER